jgi:phosphoribosylamine--glycine ligase
VNKIFDMRVLFISNDLVAGNLAYIMTKEGCDVKMHIISKHQSKNFTNLVEKTSDWKKELRWVGKEGLIVFDDIGHGKTQDQLRRQGYSVFGGCELGDKLESDRAWGQQILRLYGIKTIPTYNFKSIDSAIKFIKKNGGSWVLKQNGKASKSINFVSQFSDSRDIIEILDHHNRHTQKHLSVITLQKKVKGVEIGVGRFFNGNDWVGPIEINIEHKRFFPGDLGPTTSEMGTLAWYTDNENNKLFRETLNKLKPFLHQIKFKGDIDIGCIIQGNSIYPLEFSPRFGSPIVHLQSEIHISKWHSFLKSIADGKQYDLKWKRGYGIVTLVAVPPFPYAKKISRVTSLGSKVRFANSFKKSQFEHIHFEEVSKEEDTEEYYISDSRGYVLYVTAMGRTVDLAQKKSKEILTKIFIPKMFYRNDIGTRFKTVDILKLKKWGYL